MGQSLQWTLSRDQIARLSSTPQCSTYLSLFLSGCSPTWVSTMQCLLSSCLAHSAPSSHLTLLQPPTGTSRSRPCSAWPAPPCLSSCTQSWLYLSHRRQIWRCEGTAALQISLWASPYTSTFPLSPFLPRHPDSSSPQP